MLKLDLEKAGKEVIAAGIIVGIIQFAAITAAFRAFSDHPWPAVFGILYIGETTSLAAASREREKQIARRLEWIERTTMRSALLAIHRGDYENYESDDAFWVAMRTQAREDIEFEDGVQVAGAEIDGIRKPRALWAILGSVCGHAVITGLAWWVATLW